MSLFGKPNQGDFNLEYPKDSKRFVKAYSQGMMDGMELWVDSVTGVNYLFHFVGNSGGLTVLLDRDGRPVVSTRHS